MIPEVDFGANWGHVYMTPIKVDIWKTVKISCHKECLEFCAIFFINGEEETMRNASCSKNNFMSTIGYMYILKEASKSNPRLYTGTVHPL